MFNDMAILTHHFMSFPREKEKMNRGLVDEREK